MTSASAACGHTRRPGGMTAIAVAGKAETHTRRHIMVVTTPQRECKDYTISVFVLQHGEVQCFPGAFSFLTR